jgi:hypothetical protein
VPPGFQTSTAPLVFSGALLFDGGDLGKEKGPAPDCWSAGPECRAIEVWETPAPFQITSPDLREQTKSEKPRAECGPQSSWPSSDRDCRLSRILISSRIGEDLMVDDTEIEELSSALWERIQDAIQGFYPPSDDFYSKTQTFVIIRALVHSLCGEIDTALDPEAAEAEMKRLFKDSLPFVGWDGPVTAEVIPFRPPV